MAAGRESKIKEDHSPSEKQNLQKKDNSFFF
jgi:hypothetical protein